VQLQNDFYFGFENQDVHSKETKVNI